MLGNYPAMCKSQNYWTTSYRKHQLIKMLPLYPVLPTQSSPNHSSAEISFPISSRCSFSWLPAQVSLNLGLLFGNEQQVHTSSTLPQAFLFLNWGKNQKARSSASSGGFSAESQARKQYAAFAPSQPPPGSWGLCPQTSFLLSGIWISTNSNRESISPSSASTRTDKLVTAALWCVLGFYCHPLWPNILQQNYSWQSFKALTGQTGAGL